MAKIVNGWQIPQQGDKFNTNWGTTRESLDTKFAEIVNSATGKFTLSALSDSTDFLTVYTSSGTSAVSFDTINKTIVIEGLSANNVIISDSNKKIVSSPITSSELYYLSGVSSNIQTQLNSKLSGVTWTQVSGTPTTLSGYGITDSISVSTSGQFATSGHNHYLSALNGTLPLSMLATSGNLGAVNVLHGDGSWSSGVSSAGGIGVPVGDLYFDDVGALLHFDGVNGSSVITDVKAHAISNVGCVLSSATRKFGTASVSLNGSGSYIGIGSNPTLNVGLSDFTLEFWFNSNVLNNTNKGLVCNGYSSWSAGAIGIRYDNVNSEGIGVFVHGQPIPTMLTSTKVFASGTWYHFALTRRSNTAYLFINGVLESTTVINASLNFNLNNATYIGTSTADGSFFNGYIDEFRFTANHARYTSTFDVSTVAFDDFSTDVLGTSIQWNKNGLLYGDNNLLWDDTNKQIYTVSGVNTKGTYNINGVPHNHNGTYITSVSSAAFATSGHNHDGRYASSAHTQDWSTISGRPTTLSGYGIIDALSTSTSGQFALSAHTHLQSSITSSSGWITDATILTETIVSTVSAGAIIPGTSLTSGMSFTTFVKSLLLKTFYPTFVVPTAALASTLASSIEAGTTSSVTLTCTLTRGQIVGKTNAGIWEPATFQDYRSGAATNYIINGVNTGVVNNTVVAGYQVVEGANTWNSTVSYAQGPQPIDSLGANYNSPLVSGTLSPSVTVTGKRKAFYGTTSATSTPYTLSSEIRAITGSLLGPANGSTFTINIPVGAKMVTFAYPNTLQTVSSVTYTEGLGAQVKGVFTLTSINVEGASGYTASAYKIYTYVPASPFSSTATYVVTI